MILKASGNQFSTNEKDYSVSNIDSNNERKSLTKRSKIIIAICVILTVGIIFSFVDFITIASAALVIVAILFLFMLCGICGIGNVGNY